jgi:hypothetical protein
MPGSPKKRARARQPITPAIFGRICREVASGKSLRRVLKGKGMPGMHKFYDHLERVPAQGEQYARARQRGIELHIDGIVDLADTADADNAHAVRLKVDTRKWLASKILPRIYGDYQRVDMRASIHGQDDWGERLRRAWERVGGREPRERVINATPAQTLPAPALERPAEAQPVEAPPPPGFESEEEGK